MIPMAPQILAEGAARFGVDPSALRYIGGMDGNVYAYEKSGAAYVLKLVPTDAQRLPAIRARQAFAAYLAANGVSVATPVAAQGGEMVEVIVHEGAMVAVTAFERAPGAHIAEHGPAQMDALYQNWGRTMGRMHALSKGYDAARTALPGWREERDSFAAWCRDEAVRACWLELGRELEALPTDADGYGLIHNDLHPQNFLVAGDRLTVIDFDVAGYHWFITDVGIALFHAVWLGARRDEDREAFAAHFMRRFLAGYEAENRLAPEWLARLPQFLRYRRILLYIAFTESGEEWFRGQAAGWRADILADRPVVAWQYGA